MNSHQSEIDALHGKMTSQLNIDPELLSGVSFVISIQLEGRVVSTHNFYLDPKVFCVNCTM